MTDQPAGNDHDRAVSFRPCFPVTDLRAALAHYEQLGFEVMRYEDGAEWAPPSRAGGLRLRYDDFAAEPATRCR